MEQGRAYGVDRRPPKNERLAMIRELMVYARERLADMTYRAAAASALGLVLGIVVYV